MKTKARLVAFTLVALPILVSVRAAELSTPAPVAPTPTVITVPAPDPIMSQPAQEVLVDMSRREFASQISSANQTATTERLKAGDAPRSIEETGGAVRKLQRDRSWKAVYALFDPLAPVPPSYRTLAHPMDTRKAIDASVPTSLRDAGTAPAPHHFRDPVSHEPSLRLW